MPLYSPVMGRGLVAALAPDVVWRDGVEAIGHRAFERVAFAH